VGKEKQIMTGIRTGSQTVIAVAMGLVAVAAAVALYRHAGLPAPVAATAALSAYLLLLSGHVFAWRATARRTADAGRAPGRDRRDQEVRRLKEDTRGAPSMAPSLAAQAARPARATPPLPESRADTQRSEDLARQEPFARSAFAQAPSADLTGLAPPAPRFADQLRAQTSAQNQAHSPAQNHAQNHAMPPPLPPSMPAAAPAPKAVAQQQPSAPEDLDDYWSFRPAPAREELPPFVTGRASARPAEPTLSTSPDRVAAPPRREPVREEPAARAASPREADVEVIQDAIKRLLEEVNASEHDPRTAHAGAPQAPGRTTPTKSLDKSVDQSIDALRMTAGSMRAAENDAKARPQQAAPRASAPQPPPLPPFVRQPQARPGDARARLMADAISAGRIDVALEPILGLQDQQTRHYEVSVRLRDAEGRPIEVEADGGELRGTGLLPLFDGVRITRTAVMARRLEERGKTGSVFSTFSGESVADEHFLGELAETLHQRSSLATQLVLSFTQSDVRAFSTPEWDSLADMRALGFRFAMSHLTDLDMDFEALSEQGFAFVKLDASVFLSGLPAPSGHLPSNEVCRHLASHGLALVAERIESDDQLARVFGFGVLLGQGQLFGGARPVRADVVNTSRNRTAAA
jgi:cyclic-di-GMP phosphodiesterase, flagellum assembly factor TipF